MTALALPVLPQIASFFAAADSEPALEWVCSHCQKARGEKPKPNQTHGICRAHSRAWRSSLEAVARAKWWRDHPSIEGSRQDMRAAALSWRWFESKLKQELTPGGGK